MKAVVICPADRTAVSKLSELAPLATLPILGESLLEYWLEHLASRGAKEVQVLAADRPEQVRTHVGDGARWGLRVEVVPELRESTIAEARLKYRAAGNETWLPEPNDVVLMDHLPGFAQHPLFDNYVGWFSGVLAWFSRTASPLRVGIHQIQPGVWAGLRTRVAPSAHFTPPCWLGHNVRVGPGAVIGPMAVVEDKVFVEAGATICRSVVGRETFVGELTDLQDSLAWGNTIVNWRSGVSLEVADPLLLSALRQTQPQLKAPSWMGRLAALWLLLATLPAASWIMWRSKRRGRPALRKKIAVCPAAHSTAGMDEQITYYELASVNRWLRRWPQLWNVMRGEFTWVGNRPLSPGDAAKLCNQFERLWLLAPIGLISLADAAACPEAFSDEARAHASFYAVKADWRLDCSIFIRALAASLFGKHRPEQTERLAVCFDSPLVKGGN